MKNFLMFVLNSLLVIINHRLDLRDLLKQLHRVEIILNFLNALRFQFFFISRPECDLNKDKVQEHCLL
jgi:hypothetical protein